MILIAANRIDRELLHTDAEPLGVAVAVAIGDVFATTLPPGFMTTAHWDELTATGRTSAAPATWAQLHEEYLFHVAPLGSGHLLVAVHQARVHPFRNALLRLSGGLLLAILTLTIAVMTWVLGRILAPVARLTRAADLLGRGQLTRSRQMFDEFAERPDEVGALARAQLMATSHLHAVVKNSQRLLRHIESCIAQVDTMAATVASTATRQEDRLIEVIDILDPLMEALTQTSQGLQDAHRIVTTLSLSSTAADQMQAILSTAVRRAEALLNVKDKDKDKDKDIKESSEPRAMRTASVLQQASIITQAVAEQREVFQKVREGVAALRSCLEDALGGTRVEPQNGQQAQRAAAEIGRLAKLHGQESAALHTAAEQLRRDLIELQKQITTLDARGSEEAIRSLAEERMAGAGGTEHAIGESAELEPLKRRSERARSSAGRRGVGTSSSQNLAPVAGPSGERKGGGALTGSGVGYKPVGRSSGNHPKVAVPHEGAPSGSSFRAISTAAASGAVAPVSAAAGGGTGTGSTPGKGGASATSMGGAAANVRPLMQSPSSGANRMAPATLGVVASSMSGTPAKGVPTASSSSLGGSSLGGSLPGASSGSLRPVSSSLNPALNRASAAPPHSSGISLGGTPARGVPIASSSSLGGSTPGSSAVGASSGGIRPVSVGQNSGANRVPAASPAGSAVSLNGAGKGAPAASANSLGGSSSNLRAISISYNPNVGKASAGLSEPIASTKSLRTTADSPDASSQSLNNNPPGRRK